MTANYSLTQPAHARSEQLEIFGLLHVAEDEGGCDSGERQQSRPVALQARVEPRLRRCGVETRQAVTVRAVRQIRRHCRTVGENAN